MAEKNTHIETITLEQVPESEKKSCRLLPLSGREM